MTFAELKAIHETKKTLDELETALKGNSELKREIENLKTELVKVKKEKAMYLSRMYDVQNELSNARSQIVDMQCCGNCARSIDDTCKGKRNCDWIYFRS